MMRQEWHEAKSLRDVGEGILGYYISADLLVQSYQHNVITSQPPEPHGYCRPTLMKRYRMLVHRFTEWRQKVQLLAR